MKYFYIDWANNIFVGLKRTDNDKQTCVSRRLKFDFLVAILKNRFFKLIEKK